MEIDFYEKPGCINNTKQKALLASFGHTVRAYSLLEEAWTQESLKPFFANLPVAKWFNASAPAIKSGEIDPTTFNEATAMEALLANHLLIARPLIRVGTGCVCGFDNDLVRELTQTSDVSDMLSCPNLKNPCE